MVKIVQKIVWLLVAVIFFETWCVEGLLRPLVVPGGSMAVTLLGSHRKVVCEDCGFRFNRGVETREMPLRAVCPNCGHTGNDISGVADVSGDRVLMQKSVFFFRWPRAWEVVAFRDPAQANRIMVKRVVGLPGETISIRHGDVYANGKIRRKPLWLQRAMAVLVHDAGYSTAHRNSQDTRWVTDRWAADGPDVHWGFADGKFAHPAGVANGKPQWLTYCHGRPGFGKTSDGSTAEGSCSKFVAGPVTDLCGYNQTRPRRDEDVHAVGDLMLSLRVRKLFGHGSLSIRANDGRSEFIVRLHCDQIVDTNSGSSPAGLRRAKVEAWRDGQPLKDLGRRTVELSDRLASDGVALEVSLFDQRLLVAIDGQTVVDYAYDHDPTAADSPSNCPLALGCDGLGMIVDDVRVYRDIYYTDPYGTGPLAGVVGRQNATAVKLAADEYYVLGDNSTISSDSRNWNGGPGLSAKLLVGKPLCVHIPSRVVVVAGHQFQVPDLGRIRYIR